VLVEADSLAPVEPVALVGAGPVLAGTAADGVALAVAYVDRVGTYAAVQRVGPGAADERVIA
jgi:hypothetical protein